MSLETDVLPKPNHQKKSTYLKRFYGKITVEPLLFFYLLPSLINLMTTQNLNLEKACRVDLQFNKTACDAMVLRDKNGYDKFQEAEVQKLVSNMVALRSSLIGVFPVFLMIFLGSWSDRHGRRKPILLLPIIGELIGTINLTLCSYFMLEVPVLLTTLSEAIPISLGGSWACAFLGIYSYVSDIVPDKDKTARIGTITMLQIIAMATGTSIAGMIIRPLGMLKVYILTASLMFIALLYVVFFIKDTQNKKKPTKEPFLKDFFDVEHVKNTFRVCFKKSGSSNRKFKMILLIFIVLMTNGTTAAEQSLCYLYTRIKFGWNEKDFSTFFFVLFVVQVIGSTIALTIFSKILKLHDALLGVIAFISKFFAALVYAFSPNEMVFYAGILVEIFNGTSFIAIRSLLSKIVPSHELGQSNSVFGVCEVIIPIIFVPLYTTIYNGTISLFPGTYYLVSSGLHVISLCLFLLFYRIDKRRHVETSDVEVKQENMEKLLEKDKSNIEIKSKPDLS